MTTDDKSTDVGATDTSANASVIDNDVISDNMDLNNEITSNAKSSVKANDADTDTTADVNNADVSVYKTKLESAQQEAAKLKSDLEKAQAAIDLRNLIENDPTALQLLRRHFGIEEDTNNPDSNMDTSDNSSGESKRIADLEAELARVKAATQVINFKNEHPEMNEFKDQMAEIINSTPNISLADALLLAKAKSGKLTNNTQHEGVEGSVSGTSRKVPELSDLLETVSKAPSAKDAVKHIVTAIDSGFKLKS